MYIFHSHILSGIIFKFVGINKIFLWTNGTYSKVTNYCADAEHPIMGVLLLPMFQSGSIILISLSRGFV